MIDPSPLEVPELDLMVREEYTAADIRRAFAERKALLEDLGDPLEFYESRGDEPPDRI